MSIEIKINDLTTADTGSVERLITYLECELASRGETVNDTSDRATNQTIALNNESALALSKLDTAVEQMNASIAALAGMTDDEALNIVSGDPTAATSSNITGDIDSEGMPWDPRIHASTKSKITNGTWRLKPGVEAAYVETVKTELKQVAAIPTPPLTSVFQAPVVNIPLPPSVIGAAVSADATVITQTTATVSPSTVGPSEGITFTEFMTRITGAITAGRLTQAKVIEAVVSTGLTSLPMLSNRTDLIPGIVEALGV